MTWSRADISRHRTDVEDPDTRCTSRAPPFLCPPPSRVVGSTCALVRRASLGRVIPPTARAKERAAMTRSVGFLVLLATVLAIPLGATAEVNVNINIGPPPVIFAEPPRVVVVPRTPVYYAPDMTYNVFRFDGNYYSFYDGAWFVAVSHRGPW